MRVLNIHERKLDSAPSAIGALIDSLSSPTDRLWPQHSWPRMAFDRALGVGASGGHGPIKYFIESYSPGHSIKFRFTDPKGFNGFHRYEVIELTDGTTALRHTLEMTTHGFAKLAWPLAFRPLHDALIEDSLATAEASLGHSPTLRQWPLWVRFLRWVFASKKARPQSLSIKCL